MEINRLLAQIGEEVGLPIPLQSGWVERVEETLEYRPGNRPGEVHRQGAKGANGFEAFVGLLQWASVTPDNRAHLLQVKLLWEGWRGWHCNKAAIGQHQVNAQQVVNSQAMCPREVADAPAQRQPANASGRNEAARRRQPIGMGGMVHLAPGAAAFDASGTRHLINMNSLHI